MIPFKQLLLSSSLVEALTSNKQLCLVAKSSSTLRAPQTGACHALLSVGFPRQEYWSGLQFPFPGDLPESGIEPHVSCIGRWTLYHWATKETQCSCYTFLYHYETAAQTWATWFIWHINLTSAYRDTILAVSSTQNHDQYLMIRQMQFILAIIKKWITFIQLFQVYTEQNWKKRRSSLRFYSPDHKKEYIKESNRNRHINDQLAIWRSQEIVTWALRSRLVLWTKR